MLVLYAPTKYHLKSLAAYLCAITLNIIKKYNNRVVNCDL